MRQAVALAVLLLKNPAIPTGSLSWAKLEHAKSKRMRQGPLKPRLSLLRRRQRRLLRLQLQEVQVRKAKQRRANPTPVKPTSSSCCDRSNSRIPRSVVV